MFLLMLFNILLLSAGTLADQSITVDHQGRRIQLDGFLLEWNAQNAVVWKNKDQLWYVDAIITPEGFSGYIRSDSAVSCSSWTFFLQQPSGTKPIQFKIPSSESSIYKVDRKTFDSQGIINLEWLIPWESINLDSAGNYRFVLTGQSDCGDSLSPLQISGSKNGQKEVSLGSLILRAVLIIILIVIYLVLNAKIRERKNSKKLPGK